MRSGAGVNVFQVDVERASETDVQQLHSATDGENGNVGADGFIEEVRLKLVEARVDPVQARVRGVTPVVGGIQVATAGEDDSIELLGEVSNRLGRLPGADDDRSATRPSDGIAVALPSRDRGPANRVTSGASPSGDPDHVRSSSEIHHASKFSSRSASNNRLA